MKTIFALLFAIACASKNTDWDSGAQRQQSYRSEQAQEQVEATDLQFTTPGSSGTNQSLPH